MGALRLFHCAQYEAFESGLFDDPQPALALPCRKSKNQKRKGSTKRRQGAYDGIRLLTPEDSMTLFAAKSDVFAHDLSAH